MSKFRWIILDPTLDEAIFYLKKCIENIEVIHDQELIVNCLYIYGQILYDKGKYKECNKKCLEIMNKKQFKNYNGKHEIYELIRQSYKQSLNKKSLQELRTSYTSSMLSNYYTKYAI